MIDYSGVVPTLRRPRELVESIKSVVDQQGSTVQVFVIDDSPEGSAADAVRRPQDLRLTYLKNPNPTGGAPSAVRARG